MTSLIALFITALTLFVSGCDQELTSAETQPRVKYIVIVTDSSTGLPLDSVEISITTVFKETRKYHSSAPDGRFELDEVESFWNRFSISRVGFTTHDFIDTLSERRDSLFELPILRLVEVKLVRRPGLEPARIQVRILVRDLWHKVLTRATVQYRDSLSIERIGLDEQETGVVGLSGMASGKQLVLVQHPGNLGRFIEVSPPVMASSTPAPASLPAITVNLMPLGTALSGQVFRRVPGQGILPLGGARIVYEIGGDSLVYPRQFETVSNSDVDSLGYFRIDSLPELAGNVRYYWDDKATQPSEVLEVSLRDIQLARALKNIVLEAAGETGAPVLMSGPPDTVSSGDSLVFRFNLPVDTVKNITLREINASRGLLAQFILDSDRKGMRVFLKGEKFNPGRRYEYALDLRTATGERFFVPGSGKELLEGQVQIREAVLPQTQVIFPHNFRLAYFSSSKLQSFHPEQDDTSPLADSTSNMARLAWDWPASETARADSLDSLVVAFKDTRDHSQWTVWRTFAARGDSLSLFFSEIYSTLGFPDAGKSQFPPLRSGGDTLWLQVLPKHKDQIFFDKESILPPVFRAMGPSLWAHYSFEDTLFIGPQAGKDTLLVTFLARPGEIHSVFSLDTAYLDKVKMGERITYRKPSGINASVSTEWEWINTHSGRIIYTKSTASETLHGARFSVDLTGALSLGKPLWQRNRITSFVELRQ